MEYIHISIIQVVGPCTAKEMGSRKPAFLLNKQRPAAQTTRDGFAFRFPRALCPPASMLLHSADALSLRVDSTGNRRNRSRSHLSDHRPKIRFSHSCNCNCKRKHAWLDHCGARRHQVPATVLKFRSFFFFNKGT